MSDYYFKNICLLEVFILKIQVGDSACFSKTISEYDVYQFAGLVGDFNSAHVNQVIAEKSIFKNRIAHGMLVGSFISTVLGTKFPGDGTIYLEQNLKFLKPVYFGDTITAIVKVEEIINSEKGIIKLNTNVINQKDETVIDGYAVVMYKEEFLDGEQNN